MADLRRIDLSPEPGADTFGVAVVRGLTGEDFLLMPPDSLVPAARAQLLAQSVSQVDDPAGLPWPDIERILFACYASTFGASPELVVDCPACELRFELAPDIPALIALAPTGVDKVPLQPPHQHQLLHLRPPTAGEMEAAALLPPDAAAQALRDAMVIAVEGHVAAPGSEGSHDDSLEAAIQQALAEANAAGLQLLATACPECGAQVLCRIDPLALIEAESTRHDVVGEAQQLSTSLGWTLGRVLALPESRRRTLAAALASGASA